ncbi:unnamed protein product [Citrullus colocynthis]|uniref:Uncharacterized protein n=1 Tax=Citrullus colocynthis TaxID=252529 RepID=A0ABP0YQ13_9ROSI
MRTLILSLPICHLRKGWPKNYRPRKKTQYLLAIVEQIIKDCLRYRARTVPSQMWRQHQWLSGAAVFFSLVDTFRQIRFTEADKVSFVNI